jgi:hypothetical protein
MEIVLEESISSKKIRRNPIHPECFIAFIENLVMLPRQIIEFPDQFKYFRTLQGYLSSLLSYGRNRFSLANPISNLISLIWPRAFFLRNRN